LSARDRSLGEIVFACIQAMESGVCLNQEEVIRRHPEFAAELMEFFADRVAVDKLASPLRNVANTSSCGSSGWDPTPTPFEYPLSKGGDKEGAPAKEVQSFGDYDLIEQIGQGGMGIVFKAHHKSLHRLVAVKMIRGGQVAGAVD